MAMRLSDLIQRLLDGGYRLDQRLVIEVNESVDAEIQDVYVDGFGKICIKVEVDKFQL